VAEKNHTTQIGQFVNKDERFLSASSASQWQKNHLSVYGFKLAEAIVHKMEMYLADEDVAKF